MRRSLLIPLLSLFSLFVLSSSASAQSKLDATIFSFDGKDFVRTETTLMSDGKPATNTKLDQNSAAYKALIEKHSFTGPVTVFGHDYQASYAPIIDQSGKLTGALFVAQQKK